MGAQRIEQRDLMACRGQHREQVLPVMTGCLHGDEDLTGGTQQREHFLVTRSVFGKRGCFHFHCTIGINDGYDMRLRCDVDSGEAHTTSWRRRKSGASEPVLQSTLVHARTRQRRPRDTVRTLSTGRGRQSHARGQCLSAADAATLSRIPSMSILRGVTR